MLKVDIDVAEWPFLRDVVLSDKGKHLSTVRQLLMEIHTPRFKHQPALSAADLAEMILYVRRLNELGFSLYGSIRRGNCCGSVREMMPPGVKERCCVEAFFLNTRLSVSH